MRSQLSWSHYRELLSINDDDKIVYYINVAIYDNLGYRELITRIKNCEYERIPKETKNKLVYNNQNSSILDLVKNPIIIKSNDKYELVTEKVLQKLILEDIPSFLEELGNGFAFVKNEYKIKMGNTFNYIDLLLFNYDYNCFVVVELKISELKKEHIGQVQIYMNYIDENIRRINQDKTIGIIICKQDNNYVIKYCSDKRIISREYELI